MTDQALILCINRGSTSLKFAAYRSELGRLSLLKSGTLSVSDGSGTGNTSLKQCEQTVTALKNLLIQSGLYDPDFIIHRLVRGSHAHDFPILLTPSELVELKDVAALAPLHLPLELNVIEACSVAFGNVAQGACFDTGFFQTLPDTARRLPLPTELLRGVERCGYHGLSCEYVTSLLGGTGRTVIAHLGGGSSITAVNSGHPLDTTMGFTPAGGLMMATRCGDLDPGVPIYLLRNCKLTVAELENILNCKSGLLAVSGCDADMRTLLELADTNRDARAAIELYCHNARKHLGAMIAVLGGIDTLVFTGGIGENAPAIREMLCANLTELGLEIDGLRNEINATVISPAGSTTIIRIVHTNEERVMAGYAQMLIGQETAISAGGNHE